MLTIKTSSEQSYSIDFFVSIMLRYPEITSIKYDPVRSRIIFTFIIKEVIPEGKQVKFRKNLTLSIETFHQLEDKKFKEVRVENAVCDKIILIKVYRDVHTLSSEEIGMIVKLFRESFGRKIMVEAHRMLDEDFLSQEEKVQDYLERLKHTQLEKRLIALREEGKVLVFNK